MLLQALARARLLLINLTAALEVLDVLQELLLFEHLLPFGLEIG